jgi:hypothetical protein
MESVVRVRSKEFDNSVEKPLTVIDSRFGLRRLPKSNEKPTAFSYDTPGRGPNGEHQS